MRNPPRFTTFGFAVAPLLLGLAFVYVLGLSAMVACTDGGPGGNGGTGGMPECASAADCDDGNECTEDACSVGGICDSTPADNGAICESGACQMGECEPITSIFPCSEQGIRDAIAAGGGPHAFDCVGLTTVTTAAQILIDKDVILDGEHKLTVDGGGSTRVFSVPVGVTVELRRLAVSGGNGGHYGGGILNFGTATLVNCTVSGNTATSAGGGISNGDPQNNGLLTITTSTVSGNIVESGGGGGIANWGTATVMDSEVSENTANTAGGFGNAGVATVTNSTISGNITAYRGGGIGHQEGALTLIASTVSGNEAGDVGGAIWNFALDPATLTITKSLVDGDCSGMIVSDGYNIESPGNTCAFNRETDQTGKTPEELKLEPLADNGGPTQTHALLPGSVAIDVIPPAACLDPDGEPLTEDQRGVARPQGPACDVGAFESEQ